MNIDDDRKGMLNFGVHCSQSMSFLCFIELPSDSFDEALIGQLVDSYIEEIGHENVAHVITGVFVYKLYWQTRLLQRDTLYFGLLVLQVCIDTMFEGIGYIPLVKSTIRKARSLVVIYGQKNCWT